MIVIGLDPGNTQSAYVHLNGPTVTDADIIDNDVMLTRLEEWKDQPDRGFVLVVEQISMGGMIAGAEIFETCFWSGRFVEMWAPRRWDRVKRIKVKNHICGFSRATDGHVRSALIERFGPGQEKAVGKKKTPGPLYGITSHKWAALAVAVAWFDLNGHVPADVRPGLKPEF